MIIYPALDLKGGVCVRLYKGERERATRYNEDPLQQARYFLAQGARALHVVDLDGAFAGHSENGAIIEKIVAASEAPIQLGGGLRSKQAVEHWLERGVARVVIATLAVEHPDVALALCEKWGKRIAIALDLRDGKIATRGWLKDSLDLEPNMFLSPFVAANIGAVIVTDITRDGTLSGANSTLTAGFAHALPCEVIASGGISSLEDLLELAREPAIAGAICGRALYEEKFSLAEAQIAIERQDIELGKKPKC